MGLTATKTPAVAATETLEAPGRRYYVLPAPPTEVLAKKACECGAAAGLSGRCETCAGVSLKTPPGQVLGGSWRPSEPAWALAKPPPVGAATHNFARLDVRPDASAGNPLGVASAAKTLPLASKPVLAVDKPSRSPSAAKPLPLTPLCIQTQLRVASSGDAAETEAQEIGRRIVAMPVPAAPPDPRKPGGFDTPIRRAVAGAAQRRPIQPTLASPGVVKGIESSRPNGAPLPRPVREFMEPRFHADFSGVRVHAGLEAAQLSSQLNAHAFTVGRDIYFNDGQFQPETGAGRELIAHELAHVIQQGGSIQRAAAEAPVNERAGESVQRSIWDDIKSGVAGIVNALGDPLAFLADKANMIPGFRLLSIVLGANPITLAKVDPTPANILMAMIEFIPGGGLVTQALQNSGVFDKVGNWIAGKIKALVATVSALKAAVTTFIGSLKASDIADPGGVWDRAKRIFSEPIDQLIAFCKGVIADILKFIKDAILLPLAKLAEGTPSWDILCAVLGTNPITGEAVDAKPDVLIGGFMKLIGQEEIWQNMQKANAIPRAFAWFKGAVSAVKAFVSAIPGKFKELFTSLTIEDVVLVAGAFKKVATVFGGFVGNFISWGLTAVWNLLEIIFDVVSPGAFEYVKKTGAALHDILKNPLPFVGNLVKAAKLGFTNFASNIATHLKEGLIDWLTGSLPGVYIPKAFSLPEFGKLALSVLGISWAQIRAKIVKALGPKGETIMKGLELAFDVVKALVSGGVAAAWELVKEKLTGLKDMVVDAITGFVKSAIIEKAVPKLISIFVPGAGFLSAIISIYDTIKVFIDKLAKIAAVVKSFVDSIVAIAAGEIGGAASRVEGALTGLLSLAISFFASFVGLGDVASKVRDAIKKVQDMVDKGLDTAIAWIIGKAKGLFAYLFGDGKDKKKKDASGDRLQSTATQTTAFNIGDESHSLYASVRGGEVVLEMASTDRGDMDIVLGRLNTLCSKALSEYSAALAANPDKKNKIEAERQRLQYFVKVTQKNYIGEGSIYKQVDDIIDASNQRYVSMTIPERKQVAEKALSSFLTQTAGSLAGSAKYGFTSLAGFKFKSGYVDEAGVLLPKYQGKVRETFYNFNWDSTATSFKSGQLTVLRDEAVKRQPSLKTNPDKDHFYWSFDKSGTCSIGPEIADDRLPDGKPELDHVTPLGDRWASGAPTPGNNTDQGNREASYHTDLQVLSKRMNGAKSGPKFIIQVGAGFRGPADPP